MVDSVARCVYMTHSNVTVEHSWRRHHSKQLPLIRSEFGTLDVALVFFKSVPMRIKAPFEHV